ncbi:hypothetical protein BHM03_00049199 [Ensete ventricosum]|nr:hypothetical protein BHM03_00049199 [Ensete ventricosum]
MHLHFILCWGQGLQFRSLLPGTGGTYWSVRLLVHGSPATGRYHQKSTIGGRLREKSTVGSRLREKKGRRRRRRGKYEKKEEEEKKEPTFHVMPSPAVPACGSLACRRCPRPRALFLPREEMERGDIDIWEERKVFGSHGQVLKDDVFGRNIDNRNRTEKGITYKLVRISNI